MSVWPSGILIVLVGLGQPSGVSGQFLSTVFSRGGSGDSIQFGTILEVGLTQRSLIWVRSRESPDAAPIHHSFDIRTGKGRVDQDALPAANDDWVPTVGVEWGVGLPPDSIGLIPGVIRGTQHDGTWVSLGNGSFGLLDTAGGRVGFYELRDVVRSADSCGAHSR